MQRFLSLLVGAVALVLASASVAQQALVVRPLAERKVADLPSGELFWRIENYPSKDAAQAAAGTWSLVAEAAGKVWLFTLGSAGGSTPGGTKVSEVGPIVRIVAPQYLLRINEASGPPGSVTPVHSHRLRSVLCACRRAKHPRCAWNPGGEGRRTGGRKRCLHGNAGLQQRLQRPAIVGHVRRRCHPTVLIARVAAVDYAA